jgi:Secretion system C-terminal sorting domain
MEGFRPAVLSVLIDGPSSLPFGERGTWQAILPASYCSRSDVSYQWYYGVYNVQGQLSWIPFGANRPTATQRMGITRVELISNEPTFVYLRLVVNAGSEQSEGFFWADCSDCQTTLLAASKQEPGSNVSSWDFNTPTLQTPLTEEFTKIKQPCFLEKSYPNPAQDASTLRWQIPSDMEVSLTVYDMLRRPVLKPLISTLAPAGAHETVLNLRQLPSGNYMVMLRAGDHICTKIISIIH